MTEYAALNRLWKYMVANKQEVIDSMSKKYVMGAIALDKSGKEISRGMNSGSKTHPLQARHAVSKHLHHKIFLHAEISALVKARKKVHTIIVARTMQDENKFGLSKPCPICIQAMIEAGVQKVFYTNDDGELILMKDFE